MGPRRQVEVVRVPLLTQPSIYHDPSKLAQSVLADSSMLARLTPPSSASNVPIMQTTVGFCTIIVANRHAGHCRSIPTTYAYHSRKSLCNSCASHSIGVFYQHVYTREKQRFQVNTHLAQMHHDAVIVAVCDLTQCICRNGFAFGETTLASRVMFL